MIFRVRFDRVAGVWVAAHPRSAQPGDRGRVVSQGRTPREAKESCREAIDLMREERALRGAR